MARNCPRLTPANALSQGQSKQIISSPKVQLKLRGVLSHITVITIQPGCERMSETAQQLGAERATAAGCFVSFRLAERYGRGEESRQSRIWYGRRRIGCYRSEAVVY
jgi:hypothetical protein